MPESELGHIALELLDHIDELTLEHAKYVIETYPIRPEQAALIEATRNDPEVQAELQIYRNARKSKA